MAVKMVLEGRCIGGPRPRPGLGGRPAGPRLAGEAEIKAVTPVDTGPCSVNQSIRVLDETADHILATVGGGVEYFVYIGVGQPWARRPGTRGRSFDDMVLPTQGRKS